MESKAEIRDGSARVYITRDGMEAYLTVSGPVGEGKPLHFDGAMEMLKQAGVVYGVNRARVKDALDVKNWERSIRVARGTLPQHGRDGMVEFKFPLPGEKKGLVETADGKVDYRDLQLVQNVQKGQLLATLIAAEPGTPGMTVTNTPIAPRPGKEAIIRRGKNTVFNETGHNLYSIADGHVAVLDGRIVVEAVYEIRGDVDFSTGNVEFVGDVVIAGGVTSGFTVKAGGNIEIGGSIESAQIVAGGNITIRKGIAGADKCLIQAGGIISARFIENARVVAGEEVVVQDAIVQSYVRSGRTVQVEGRRGKIVGGTIQARDEISARVIGSTFATQTYLEVGANTEVREEYHAIMHQYKEKRKAFETVAQNVKAVQKALGSLENVSDKRRLAMLKLLGDYRSLSTELNQMEERRLFLDQEFSRMQGGRIKVADTVYPGVHITIGRAIYIVNDPVKFAMFMLEDGEVKVTPLR